MTLEHENAFVIISKLLMRNLSHVDKWRRFCRRNRYLCMSNVLWALDLVEWIRVCSIYVASHISTVICKASSTHFLLQSKFVACERHENRNKRNTMAYVQKRHDRRMKWREKIRVERDARFIFGNNRTLFFLLFIISRNLLSIETKIIFLHEAG